MASTNLSQISGSGTGSQPSPPASILGDEIGGRLLLHATPPSRCPVRRLHRVLVCSYGHICTSVAPLPSCASELAAASTFLGGTSMLYNSEVGFLCFLYRCQLHASILACQYGTLPVRPCSTNLQNEAHTQLLSCDLACCHINFAITSFSHSRRGLPLAPISALLLVDMKTYVASAVPLVQVCSCW